MDHLSIITEPLYRQRRINKLNKYIQKQWNKIKMTKYISIYNDIQAFIIPTTLVNRYKCKTCNSEECNNYHECVRKTIMKLFEKEKELYFIEYYRKHIAVFRIQIHYNKLYYNPETTFCQNRFIRQFNML